MKLNDEFFYCIDTYIVPSDITVFVGTMEMRDYTNIMKDDCYTLTDPYRPSITNMPVKLVDAKPIGIRTVQCTLYNYKEIGEQDESKQTNDRNIHSGDI